MQNKCEHKQTDVVYMCPKCGALVDVKPKETPKPKARKPRTKTE